MKYINMNGNVIEGCSTNYSCKDLPSSKTFLYQKIDFPIQYAKQANDIRMINMQTPIAVATYLTNPSLVGGPLSYGCNTTLGGLSPYPMYTRFADTKEAFNLDIPDSNAGCSYTNSRILCENNGSLYEDKAFINSCRPSPLSAPDINKRCKYVNKVIEYTYTVQMELVSTVETFPCVGANSAANFQDILLGPPPADNTIYLKLDAYPFGESRLCESNNPCNTNCGWIPLPKTVNSIFFPFKEYSVNYGDSSQTSISNIAYHIKNTDCDSQCNNSLCSNISDLFQFKLLEGAGSLLGCDCWLETDICYNTTSAAFPDTGRCPEFTVLNDPNNNKICNNKDYYMVCKQDFLDTKQEIDSKYGPGTIDSCFTNEDSTIKKEVDYCGNSSSCNVIKKQTSYDAVKLFPIKGKYHNIVTKTYTESKFTKYSIPGLPPGNTPFEYQVEDTLGFLSNTTEGFTITVTTAFCELTYENCE